MDPGVRAIILDELHLPKLDQADPSGVPEADFINVALRVLTRLRPDCHVFRFAAKFRSDGSNRHPDLAMFDRGLQYWIVVEVETTAHSFSEHVLPQCLALRDGVVADTAGQLVAPILDVSPDQAMTLVRHLPRYMLVVADAELTDWRSRLASENISYISIAKYVQPNGPSAFLATGSFAVAERSLGFGQVFGSNRAIRIAPTRPLTEPSYTVVESTGASKWTAMTSSGFTWLLKERGAVAGDDKSWVQLIELPDGQIQVQYLS